jgi:sugar lactone lactonase YvrE
MAYLAAHRRHISLIGLALLAFLAGCQSGASHSSASARPSPTSIAATPTASATAKPLSPPSYTRVILAHAGAPDDLAFDAAGHLLFVDQANGTLNRLAADGSVTMLARNLDEPEGVLPLANGDILVGVQGANGEHRDEIDRVSPIGVVTTVIRFANDTANPGLDSLALDSATGDLIVPDSPNGVVYRVTLQGRIVATLAKEFVRPVAAIRAGDGALIIADEWGNRVVRMAPDGVQTTLAQIRYPDDLAFDLDGSLLVTSLGSNALLRVTAHGVATIAANINGPQGLVVDANGNIFVSAENTGEIFELQRDT